MHHLHHSSNCFTTFITKVPIGPFASNEILTHKVKVWASNPKTGPGGFPCGKKGLRKPTATSPSGEQQRYGCMKERCPFSVDYELSTDGWILQKFKNIHSEHAFYSEELEAAVDANCNSMPPDYIALLQVRDFAPARLSPSQHTLPRSDLAFNRSVPLAATNLLQS